jgi:hypothetical protein
MALDGPPQCRCESRLSMSIFVFDVQPRADGLLCGPEAAKLLVLEGMRGEIKSADTDVAPLPQSDAKGVLEAKSGDGGLVHVVPRRNSV